MRKACKGDGPVGFSFFLGFLIHHRGSSKAGNRCEKLSYIARRIWWEGEDCAAFMMLQ